MRIIIKTAADMPEVQSLAARLASDGVPADATLIYDGGRNRLYSYSLPSGMRVCIKAFKVPSLLQGVVYATVRRGKARRSYEHAQRLLQLGFLTPEPLAWVEVRRGLRLMRSYYVCQWVDADTVRDWEEKPDCEQLLDALAAEMTRLHSAGVWHKDFSPGNILYAVDPAQGYRLYLVDINRMKFGVHSRRRQLDNFRSIHLDEAQLARLARKYALCAGLDPDLTVSQAIGRLRDYKSGKERKRRLKRLFGSE